MHIPTSYEETLELAGATVHIFQEFGSYQGDWWARVTYNGVTGWVTGSYGSCSGCDAFHGEFDDTYYLEDDKYDAWREYVRDDAPDTPGNASRVVGSPQGAPCTHARFRARLPRQYDDAGRGRTGGWRE